jgi:hypothetical protein
MLRLRRTTPQDIRNGVAVVGEESVSEVHVISTQAAGSAHPVNTRATEAPAIGDLLAPLWFVTRRRLRSDHPPGWPSGNRREPDGGGRWHLRSGYYIGIARGTGDRARDGEIAKRGPPLSAEDTDADDRVRRRGCTVSCGTSRFRQGWRSYGAQTLPNWSYCDLVGWGGDGRLEYLSGAQNTRRLARRTDSGRRTFSKASPRGLDRQPHGSLMTQRWRKPDSNPRSHHIGKRLSRRGARLKRRY